jgi:hypothetical protein
VTGPAYWAPDGGCQPLPGHRAFSLGAPLPVSTFAPMGIQID